MKEKEMAFEGMDVAAVQGISKQLANQATAIGTVISTVDSIVGNAGSVWQGPDVSKFVADWHSHKSALTSAQTAITHLSQKAMQNANTQDATSKTY
jgi:uncharacterized protein YukE